MKKLLLAILLTIISTNAMAEWTKVAKSYDSDQYVDISTKKKFGNKVKVWSLSDYQTPQNTGSGEFLSTVIQYEFDCANEYSKFLSVTLYKENMQMGSVVQTFEFKSQNESITPNSIVEAKFKYVCGKR